MLRFVAWPVLVVPMIVCGLLRGNAAAEKVIFPVKPTKQLQSNAPIDEIIEALKSKDNDRRGRAVEFVGYRAKEAVNKGAVLPLIKALSDARTRYSALHSLIAFGPHASAATPALFKVFTTYPDDPACHSLAAQALAGIGQEAVPTLLNGTQSDKLVERLWCHAALARMEGPNSEHLQELTKVMLASDPAASLLAIRGLWMIGLGAKSTLPQIIAAFDNPAASKMDLAEVLIKFGKEAAPAIPQLVKQLDNPHGMTSQRAAYALAEIGGEGLKPAIPGLIQMLSNQHGYIRETAARALGNAGPLAASAVKPLIELLLKDTEEHPRAEAATALGKIAPTEPAVVTALIEAMKDKSGRVRSHVAPVLAKHAPLTPEVKQVFRNAATDNWGGVMNACRIFISRLEPEEQKTFPSRFRNGFGLDIKH